MMIFLALLVAASCVPTQESGVGLPRDQNPIQAALTATTLTPTTSTPTLTSTDPSTPSPTPTDTPTPTPTATLTYTPTPTIDEQAVMLAEELAPQFSQIFGVQFDPSLANGLDAARIGGPAGQLAGMIAPVFDENQKYKDRNNKNREVEGIFSLNDNRLTLETMIIINKANIQYPLLPVGAYMLACHPQRVNDCIAVSLQGEEFQIKPEIIFQTELPDQVSPPQVAYEEGSIHKCFKVLKRKICIRVFR